MRVCKYGHKGWRRGGVRHAEEGGGYHGGGREGETGEEGGRGGGLPCRLQGIKTSEIYSSLDWSGLARFGVASTKKGAILLVTSNEGAAALYGDIRVLSFADFNKTVLKTAARDWSSHTAVYTRGLSISANENLNNRERKRVYFKTKRPVVSHTLASRGIRQ